MLEFLRGKASDRKLRLFACACCRRIWHLLPDALTKEAVETAERYADGLVDQAELIGAGRHIPGYEAGINAVTNAAYLVTLDARLAVYGTSDILPSTVPSNAVQAACKRWEQSGRVVVVAAMRSEWEAQSARISDIFGNPFRPVSLAPAWLTPAVRNLAQAAYDNRLLPSGLLDNAGLAVLADALEEAGCTSADILSHLRGPGPHVRGCFVLDLLLGKE
jgi:hypothetical protein